MTKIKHTPGPWAAIIDPNHLTHRVDGQHPEHSGPIASVHVTVENERQDEANAKLIAAAPKMLEALQAIAARINGEFDNPVLLKYGLLSTDPEEDVIRIAREAIEEIEP